MNKLIRRIDNALKWILAAMMLSIVLVVCWQVVSRYLLNSPSSITEELSRCLLIWIGMLGAALAYRTGVHLGLDIVTQRFNPRNRQRLAMLVSAAVVLFALAVMVVGGGNLVALTFELNQMSAALGIRMAYIYLIIPFSGSIMVFYGVCQLYYLNTDQTMPTVEGLH